MVFIYVYLYMNLTGTGRRASKMLLQFLFQKPKTCGRNYKNNNQESDGVIGEKKELKRSVTAISLHPSCIVSTRKYTSR